MNEIIHLSVHQLVDFLLRKGDIDNRIFNRSTMLEGSRLHAFYQNKQKKNYFAEYPLKTEIIVEGITFLLEGRADGIIKNEDGSYAIDEIKTTVSDLNTYKEDNIDWFLGQAKCYAYMFSKEQKLLNIDIQMTYIRQLKEKEKLVDYYSFSFYELEQYVYSLLNDFLSFYNLIFESNKKRDISIKKMVFPFKNFRKGQRDLSKYCYGIATNGGRLFIEAPTGIGKTISTIFPFIKSIINDPKEKIFYLTAKNSGKESAFNAIKLLKNNGLYINNIVITAKDKICLNSECKACNPDECPFAKNYYSKIQSILKFCLINYTTFDYDLITQIALENQVCPFELELDLSLFCDIIICDYNYLFDPISYAKRYFDEDSSHFLALVDEAHNLVDRSRNMYSSSIGYDLFLKAKKSVRHSKLSKLKRQISKINKLFVDSMIDISEDEEVILPSFNDKLIHSFENFLTSIQSIAKENHKEITKELNEFSIELNRFLKIYDLSDESFLYYVFKHNNIITFEVFCLDASPYLRAISQRLKGLVYFSATMRPMDYYIDVLGGDKNNDPNLILSSPFNKNNLNILIAPKISVTYKNRKNSYEEVSKFIKIFTSTKIGNYFVYCPSYEYLSNLIEYLDLNDCNVFIQNKSMSDKEKMEFLENFSENPSITNIGLFVIGGAFGEGIDLVSDRLIGEVIIGIGLPKINFKSNKIAEYYTNDGKPGRDYAYTNPGMNKVMQAVGRVIRSETDKGKILLIDERYLWKNYQELFNHEWKNYKVILNEEDLIFELNKHKF